MSTEGMGGSQEPTPELVSDDALAALSGDDLAAIGDALLAGTSQEARSAWPAAQAALGKAFPTGRWGTDHAPNEFSPDGRGNLYRAEMPSDFKAWLSERGIDERGYANAIMPVQYNSVQVWLKKLFHGPQRANRGWRIRLVGFPSLGVIAVGLGSNYQGTQNQNKMGEASALIRTAALNVLARNPPVRAALEPYPSATSDHWDERGLMPEPIFHVGDIDITGYDPRGARLRMIRNTTVKKDLATFFCIRGTNYDAFLRDGDRHVAALRRVASALGEEGGA